MSLFKELNELDDNLHYRLTKMNTKNESTYGYRNGSQYTGTLEVITIGDETCIIINEGGYNWFRTSLIQKVTKINDCEFKIESLNSIYKLEIL